MKKIIAAASTVFTFLHNQSKQSRQNKIEKLKALNATFIHNFVTNDIVSHNEIIHHEFVCITSDGRTVGREEYMKNWQHGYDGYVYWDYRDEHISIIGKTALVRSQNKYVVIKDGKEISGMSIYTDTYIMEKGEWKCVQAQLGNVSTANYANDDTIIRKYDSRE